MLHYKSEKQDRLSANNFHTMIKSVKTELKKNSEIKNYDFKKKVFSYVVAKGQGKLIFLETENHLNRQELLQTS